MVFKEFKKSMEDVRKGLKENREMLANHFNQHAKGNDVLKKMKNNEITMAKQYLLIDAYKSAMKMMIVSNKHVLENYEKEDSKGYRNAINIFIVLCEDILEEYEKHYMDGGE